MICFIDITEGPASGKQYSLRDGQTLEVGRMSTSDISIPSDAKMSRHHLLIECSQDTCRIRDVGSANGTYVNNARVSNIVLCDGDQIRAGLTTLQIRIRTGETQLAARMPAQSTNLASVSNGDYWTNFFVSTTLPGLSEASQALREMGADMSDVLQLLGDSLHVTAMVDSSLLSRFGREMLQRWQHDGYTYAVNSTQWLISGPQKADFFTFIRVSLQRDALILFVSNGPRELPTYVPFCEAIRVPSRILPQLATHPEPIYAKLPSGTTLLFEADKVGSLHIYRNTH